VEDLIPKFAELDEIMRAYKSAGRDKVTLKLQQWDKKFEEWKEIRLAIKLQVRINEGNELLRAMVKAKQEERWEDVEKAFHGVEALVVDRMRPEERDEFHRNADAIFVRAKALSDESAKLKRVKAQRIVVSAIVLDPRPEGRNRTIIFCDGHP